MEGTQHQWGNEARRGQAPAMGSNFGEIGQSVAELWASASACGKVSEVRPILAERCCRSCARFFT